MNVVPLLLKPGNVLRRERENWMAKESSFLAVTGWPELVHHS